MRRRARARSPPSSSPSGRCEDVPETPAQVTRCLRAGDGRLRSAPVTRGAGRERGKAAAGDQLARRTGGQPPVLRAPGLLRPRCRGAPLLRRRRRRCSPAGRAAEPPVPGRSGPSLLACGGPVLAARRSQRGTRGSCAPRSRKSGQCLEGSVAAGSSSHPIHSFIPGRVRRQVGGGCRDSVRSIDFFFFFFFIPAVLSPLEAQLSTAGLSFSPVHATRHMPECGSAGGGLRVQRSAPPELSPVPARRPRTRARAIPATPRQGPGAAVPQRRRNGRDGAAAPRGRVSAAAAGLGHRAGLLSN